MKIRSLVLVAFCLLMSQAVFGGNLSNCTNRPTSPVSDGSGGYLTQFDCTFYLGEYISPFNLVPYIDQGAYSAWEYENWMTPGYMVFTTDLANTADYAAWVAVLEFHPDQLVDVSAADGYDGSGSVELWWPGYNMPTYSQVINFGNANFGTAFVQAGLAFTDSVGNHSFSVVSGVPEPSTLLMAFSAGLGILALRRRRRS